MRDEYKRVLETYSYTHRDFIDYTVTKLEDNWNSKNLFLIEAPTGYGKSTITATIALKTYNEKTKLIIAFPLRTLLEDQYNKLTKLIKDDSILGKRYMHEPSSRYLIKPITLTTIDTLSLTMFGLAPEDLSTIMKSFNEWTGTMESSTGHYLFSWSSVALSNILLDEVHLLSDSTKSISFLIALIKYVISNDQKIILMSATIPRSLEEKLDEALYEYKSRILKIRFDECIDKEFIEERKKKRYSILIEEVDRDNKLEFIESKINEGISNGMKRVLIIFNTIDDAINLYKKIKESYDNCLLLHSRFSEKDRVEKIKRLQDIKDKYIVIATQVVEAGVDISSDLLISELAPANSLVQRFGRFLRYNEEEGSSYIWYEPFGDNRYKVYDLDLCKRTLEYLKEDKVNMHIPNENGYKGLLDYVYQKDSFSIDRDKIDEMLITFTNFGNISHAVDLFHQLEGSFVREGLIIPVTIKDDAIRGDEIIPISYTLFERLAKSNKVRCIIKDKGKEIDLQKIKEMIYKKKVIRYITNNNIKAFVIDANYDNEMGLYE